MTSYWPAFSNISRRTDSRLARIRSRTFQFTVMMDSSMGSAMQLAIKIDPRPTLTGNGQGCNVPIQRVVLGPQAVP